MSEILDSNRFSGQNIQSRANFSQTCNLLARYMKKENATFGDFSLGTRATSPTHATMNLFPMADINPGPTPNPRASFPQQAAASPVPKKQPESAQMTIFYAGKVVVFDDLPPEKAKEIMMLAEKGSSQKPSTFQSASVCIPKPDEPSNNTVVQDRIQLQRPQPVVSDLPIARKASLTRFLEKRKDRITARSPYQGQAGDYGPSKEDDSRTWLGLAAQSDGQFPARSQHMCML